MPEPDRPVFDLERGVSLEPLLQRYGQRRGRMEPLYHAMLAEATRLVAPAVVERSFDSQDLPELAVRLPGASKIVLGLCTIGSALEQHMAAMFPEEPAQAVILDEIGNAWVAGLARQLHHNVRLGAEQAGLSASPGFRPGIGHWPVELQAEIVQRLDVQPLSITLTEGFMLEPRKTVTLIVGLGRRMGRSGYAPP